jgi:hypothetical protein
MVWNVTGPWKIHQSPMTTVTLNLEQFAPLAGHPQAGILTGDIIGDTASSVTTGGPTLNSTAVSGAIIANQFFLSITWENGSTGIYNGTFGIPPTNTPMKERRARWEDACGA